MKREITGTVFVVLLTAVLLASGCSKKESPPEPSWPSESSLDSVDSLDSESSAAEASSQDSSGGINALLDRFEKVMTKAVELSEKAAAGDASALKDYMPVFEELNELIVQIDGVSDEFDDAQALRYYELSQKLGGLIQ